MIINLLIFLGGVMVTTIFFLIREINAKKQFEEVWEEVYEFEDRMMSEINYTQDTVQDETQHQWDEIHEQWSHINNFEDRLIEVLDEELDGKKIDYVKGNHSTKKDAVDDESKLDEILTKITKSGKESLSKEEQKFLDNYNKKKK